MRIEGATQGSGVLVERSGDTYTVVTAWHVVKDNNPGEEIDVFTWDGKAHSVETKSIRRIKNLDLAVLSFRSLSDYSLAKIGNPGESSLGADIFVSGFPVMTEAVPFRSMRFLKGSVVGKPSRSTSDGYGFLYSNATLPGMSGGGVFNSRGDLFAVHGRGETDISMSEQRGVAVKTQTNLGIPISDSIVSAIKSINSESSQQLKPPTTTRKENNEKIVSNVNLSSSNLAMGSTVTKAATNNDIFLYRGMGASLLCNARAAGVDFRKAVGAAAATYVQILNGRHGGKVISAGNRRLTNDQLFAGAEFQIITGAIQFCSKEVSEYVKSKVRRANL